MITRAILPIGAILRTKRADTIWTLQGYAQMPSLTPWFLKRIPASFANRSCGSPISSLRPRESSKTSTVPCSHPNLHSITIILRPHLPPRQASCSRTLYSLQGSALRFRKASGCRNSLSVVRSCNYPFSHWSRYGCYYWECPMWIFSPTVMQQFCVGKRMQHPCAMQISYMAQCIVYYSTSLSVFSLVDRNVYWTFDGTH